MDKLPIFFIEEDNAHYQLDYAMNCFSY